MLEIIYISVTTACLCSIWATNLTDLDGLLWWIPKYYPNEETFFGKVLRCAICLSGWLTLLGSLAFCIVKLDHFTHILPATFLSMALSKIIIKQ